MPRNPQPKTPPLKNVRGYWTAQPYIESGARPTWTFGNASKVTRAQAMLALQARLRRQNSAPIPGYVSPTLEALIQAYLAHAEGYYRRADGSATGEASVILYALQPLIFILGKLDAGLFRPRHLRMYVDAQISAGVGRTTIVARVGKIKGMLKWAKNEEVMMPVAAEGETVPQHPYDAVRDFAAPAPGRSAAREPQAVQAVADAVVSATARFLPPTLAAMIAVQRLTGARPDEICRMRMVEIESGEGTWVYQPRQHKTAHRNKARRVLIGPRARAILQARAVGRPIDGYLFSPAEAEAERRGTLPPEWLPPELRRARPDCRRRFSVGIYRQAIWHATHRAFPPPAELLTAVREARSTHRRGEPVPAALAESARRGRDWQLEHHWSPNQLRHAGLSDVNRVREAEEAAQETAQALAGHGDKRTTRRYLRREDLIARAVIEQVG